MKKSASTASRMRLLRIFLGFSAFAWGVSLYGVFASWESAEWALRGLGARPISFDPMLDYWLRMAAGAFGLVGVIFLILTIWLERYANVIPLFGWLMILEGVILLVQGVRLGLPPMPFYGDTAACFVGGAGILAYRPLDNRQVTKIAKTDQD